MILSSHMVNRLLPPVLTRRRIGLAYGVAAAADAIQLLLTPFGPPAWFLDEILDIVTMVTLTMTLGFHPLLLPTFITESIPVIDVLPTWTGCTALVVALRRKRQTVTPPPTVHVAQDAIDV